MGCGVSSEERYEYVTSATPSLRRQTVFQPTSDNELNKVFSTLGKRLNKVKKISITWKQHLEDLNSIMGVSSSQVDVLHCLKTITCAIAACNRGELNTGVAGFSVSASKPYIIGDLGWAIDHDHVQTAIDSYSGFLCASFSLRDTIDKCFDDCTAIENMLSKQSQLVVSEEKVRSNFNQLKQSRDQLKFFRSSVVAPVLDQHVEIAKNPKNLLYEANLRGKILYEYQVFDIPKISHSIRASSSVDFVSLQCFAELLTDREERQLLH